MKWKQLTGVLCDKKVPVKLKDNVYKTVIKPTMTYGAECWAVRKKDENRLHVAEIRMLQWIRGKTRKDHVRNQIIQDDAKVCQMSTFLRQKNDYIGTDMSREEKKTTYHDKWWTLLYWGREEGSDLDWDGPTTTEKIWPNTNWQLTWLKTGSTGRWW